MKRLSDYTGKDAIELWADIFDPLSKILEDEEISKAMSSTDVKLMEMAKVTVKKYPDEISAILERLDKDDVVNGANVFSRVVIILAELRYGDKVSTFFKSAEQEDSGGGSSGSATENTEDGSK